jgi:tetratricopeptide (TPR) repeat protein
MASRRCTDLRRAVRAPREYATAWILIFGVFLPGCGGGGSGESLTAQYQQAMQVADAELQVTELLRVAEKQHAAGDSVGVDRSLVSASDAAKRVADAGGRATALNRIGMVTARMNRPYEAKTLFRDVQKMLGDVADPEARSALLTRMAFAYERHLGEAREAADLLDRAEQNAGQIGRDEGRIEALLEVAYTYHGLGHQPQAEQRLNRSLEDARNVQDVRKRADSLASAATIVTKMNQEDQAKTLFQEAQQTAAEIPDPLSRAYAYVHLGTKLIEANLRGAAQRVLQLAEDSADKVTDQSMRGPLMDRIYATRRRTSA